MMPPDLKTLQHAFLAGVQKGDQTILKHIIVADPATPSQRLGIYRDSRLLNLQGVLQEMYPVCLQIVGTSFFKALAERYVKDHYPSTPDMRNWAKAFADFIADFPHTQSLPYLADVVRLECFWLECYNGPDPKLCDWQTLAAVPESAQADIIFLINPNAVLFSSDYPIVKIWSAHKNKSENIGTIDISTGGESVVLWRTDEDVSIHLCEAEQFACLSALKNGLYFGQLCEKLNLPGDSLQRLLQTMIQQGLVTGFKLGVS